MLTEETVLSFGEAAKRIPPIGDKRPHGRTIRRWSKKGLKGVRLEFGCMGGRYFTTLEALGRFAEQLAEVNSLPPAPVQRPHTGRASTKQLHRPGPPPLGRSG